MCSDGYSIVVCAKLVFGNSITTTSASQIAENERFRWASPLISSRPTVLVLRQAIVISTALYMRPHPIPPNSSPQKLPPTTAGVKRINLLILRKSSHCQNSSRTFPSNLNQPLCLQPREPTTTTTNLLRHPFQRSFSHGSI